MRYDFVVPNEGSLAPEAVKNVTVFEDIGWDGLWLTDHVIGLKAYRPVYSGYWLEVLTTMAYVAARTKKARIGVGVLVVPYRNPVMTAKILSTIDFLSDGRVDFGVGTGWARREYEALGQADHFEKRGEITNASLDLILKCWQGGEFAHESEHFNFRNMMFEPVPVQKPRIPLWIGALGTAKRPMERAAKYADYWHPGELTPEELKEGGARLADMAGRKIPITTRIPVPFGTDASEVAAKANSFEEVGCEMIAFEVKDCPTYKDLANFSEQIKNAL